MPESYMLAHGGQVVLTAIAEKKPNKLLQTPTLQAFNLGQGAIMLVQLGLANESGSRIHMVNVPAQVIAPLESATIYHFERHTQLEREDADFEDLVTTLERNREMHVLVAQFATPSGLSELRLPLQIQFTPDGFVLNARLPQTVKPRAASTPS